MATITVNCATAANSQAATVISNAVSALQAAVVYVSPTGTYDTGAAPSVDVTNVDQAIENSRRNGKTVTLVSACAAQAGYDATNDKHWAFSVAAVAGNDVECEIHEVAGAEYANGVALPTFSTPLGIYVTFTEA